MELFVKNDRAFQHSSLTMNFLTHRKVLDCASPRRCRAKRWHNGSRREVLCSSVLALLCLGFLEAPGTSAAAAANWPQFRGPNASGQNGAQVLPTTWSVERGENIRWQTPIPGLAHASPIIWDGKLY